MNVKKLAISVIAAFVTVYAFEWLWHGILMNDMYQATASVWRPSSEANYTIMTAAQFLFALSFTVFYAKVGKHLECKRGVAFGLLTGLLLGLPDIGAYSYLPIPLTLALMWVLANIFKCIVTGVVVAFIYKE